MRRFLSDERGATAIEYAILAMIVTVTMIAAFALIGEELTAMLAGANAAFD